MRSLRKNMAYIIVTFFLVLVSAFCICGTVMSQEKGISNVEAQYYRQIEQEYVKEVRNLLEEQGYRNSGVTMTYIVSEDGKGGREYTVTIHHKKISTLDRIQREELLKACREIVFPIQDCIFFHEFLPG